MHHIHARVYVNVTVHMSCPFMQALVGASSLHLSFLLMATHPCNAPLSLVVGGCPQGLLSGAGKEELHRLLIPHMLQDLATPNSGLTKEWKQK